MRKETVDEMAESVEECFRKRIGHRVTGVVIKDSVGTEHPPGRRRVIVEFEGAPPLAVYMDIAEGLPVMYVMEHSIRGWT